VNPKVRVAITFIEKNLKRDIYVEEAARLVRLSRSRFSHLFKTEAGMSFIQYLKKARLEKARELLETTFEPIKVIVRSRSDIKTQLTSNATSGRLTV
jgi:two-component system response regulator YesN